MSRLRASIGSREGGNANSEVTMEMLITPTFQRQQISPASPEKHTRRNPSPRKKSTRALALSVESSFVPFKFPDKEGISQENTVMKSDDREELLGSINVKNHEATRNDQDGGEVDDHADEVHDDQTDEEVKQVFQLMTSCLGLDERSTKDCHDLVDGVLSKWLRKSGRPKNETLQELWERLDRAFASSHGTESLHRKPAVPSDMKIAILCDCFNVLIQQCFENRRVLETIREGLFTAIYSPPVPEIGDSYFQATTWCSRVDKLYHENKKLRIQVAKLEAEKAEAQKGEKDIQRYLVEQIQSLSVENRDQILKHFNATTDIKSSNSKSAEESQG